MIVPVLGAWYISLLATFFIIICVFMVLVVLIQKPRGGGLSGAFGGGGGSAQAAFGAKTGDFLTWFTVGCFVCFLGLAMGLTWALAAHQKGIIEPPPIIAPIVDEPEAPRTPARTPGTAPTATPVPADAPAAPPEEAADRPDETSTDPEPTP